MDDQPEVREMDAHTPSGHAYHLSYERTGDIVEIAFPGVRADCAVELTDHILLRLSRDKGEAAGLTILGYSVLATPSDLGPRSFAMIGLGTMPEPLRDVVTSILNRAPVNHFLKFTTYQTARAENIPLTFLESTTVLPLAS